MGRQAFVIAAVLAIASCQGGEVSRSLGARCSTSAECDERCLLPSAEYPEGLCTVDCVTSRDCPESAICADREGGVCLIECLFDEDCAFLGTGWSCKDTDARDVSTQVRVCRGD